MNVSDPDVLLGRTVVGVDGDEIGTVCELYLDQAAGGGWAAVQTGWFVSPVPLDRAELRDDVLVVPYDKDRVKGAPHHDPVMALSREEEAALFDHYGVPHDARAEDTTTGSAGAGIPTTDDYTTEDVERPTPELHVGAAPQTRLRSASGPVVDVTEPATYADDPAPTDGGMRGRATSAGASSAHRAQRSPADRD